MNGDGRLDFGVSVNGAYTERAPIYLDDGAGVYRPVQIPSSQPFFAFADANGDGLPDIVSASGGTTEIVDVQLQLEARAAPAAPAGVRVSVQRDRIHLSWAAVPGATAYEIWRSAPRGARHAIGTVSKPVFDDRKAKRGVRYTYVVRAVSELGKSSFSAPVTGRRH